METLLIQAKRACETTIITGLYSTETLYLVPDNLRKLSSLYVTRIRIIYLIIRGYIYVQDMAVATFFNSVHRVLHLDYEAFKM